MMLINYVYSIRLIRKSAVGDIIRAYDVVILGVIYALAAKRAGILYG